jgi:multiple sugar transport system permease protein
VEGLVFPFSPSLDNYLGLFGLLHGASSALGDSVRQDLLNSLVVASAVMVLTMAVCIPAAYALGRLKLRGKTAIIGFLIGTRAIPPVSLALPYYFLFFQLRIKGTLFGIVVAHLSITTPIVAWVLAGFFAALPRDIEMMARIDGCSRFEAFRRILLPLARPGIASTAIIAFMYSWNDYLFAWLLSSGSPAETYNALLDSIGPSPVFAAAVMVQVLVALVLASFLQKYIASIKIVGSLPGIP